MSSNQPKAPSDGIIQRVFIPFANCHQLVCLRVYHLLSPNELPRELLLRQNGCLSRSVCATFPANRTPFVAIFGAKSLAINNFGSAQTRIGTPFKAAIYGSHNPGTAGDLGNVSAIVPVAITSTAQLCVAGVSPPGSPPRPALPRGPGPPRAPIVPKINYIL